MSNKTGRKKRYASGACFFTLARRGLLNWLPDQAYLSALWQAYYHKKLDWKNPKSFNEKIQWLKVFDRNPLYPTLVDKYSVREYIKNKVGEEYLIRLVGGPWSGFDEIDFSQLPERFVLKCTHDSGGVVICRGKDSFDMKSAREKIEKSLRRNYYWGGREWPYRDIQPRIIAEEYIGSSAGTEPTDYKLIMFGGELRCLFVTTNRFTGKKMNMTFFDTDWNQLPFERMYPTDQNTPVKPERYDEMIRIAKQLSKGLALTRIDLYEIDRKVYCGEITLYPGSGLETFQPEEWDYTLGEWLDLERYFPGRFV